MGVLANIRNDYNLGSLDERDVQKNPITQTSLWLEEAIKFNIHEPTAIHLSTVSESGRPSSRIVLLKEITKEGFVFFTNYESKKGKELSKNPYVALVLFWKELERQVRIEGITEKISTQSSDDYFNSRPLGSRIGAIASPQSTIIKDRTLLEKKVNELEGSPLETIKRPEYWGGYLVKPTYIEFWQGRKSRLHDRLAFTLEQGQWTINRLAP